MIICLDKNVNGRFDEWLNKMYGVYGKVKSTCGKLYNYLGMKFYFSEKYKVGIDMIDYMNKMVNNFSIKLKPNGTSPDPTTGVFFYERQ